MRVLLINPPRNNEIIGNNPNALEESRGYNPPLGILFLAGYLQEHTEHSVKIMDAQAEKLSWAEIGARIANAKPDIVGLTVMTQTLIDVMRIVEISHVKAPRAKVVLGGPHVHLFPGETITLPGIDYVVLGEGERTFRELVDKLEAKDDLENISGLVFKRGRKIINTGFPEMVNDLDALSFPARNLTDVKLYDSVLMPRSPVTTLFTSRGCPYVCSFCDRPHLGKKFRARSADNVIAEIEECKRLGIRDFLIYDDTFTVRRDRVFDICRKIIDNKLDIHFDARARIDTVDDEILRLMKEAGCQGIHYGVEAGTEKILRVLRKGITLEQAEDVFRLTHRIGIKTLAYFMIGSPSETKEDIEETFRFAKKLDSDYMHLTILTPFPGTEIYRRGMESGVIKTDVWREFAKNPHLGFIPPYWSENFSLEELKSLLIQGYKEFYRRPAYLFKRTLEVRNCREFGRKFRAGIRLLTMRSRQ
ncbi:MAG: radical SAM protein [Chitinispirillaceae bacterium]|nr:radical SAM protein [Chitinispirillaceae bacterium]